MCAINLRDVACNFGSCFLSSPLGGGLSLAMPCNHYMAGGRIPSSARSAGFFYSIYANFFVFSLLETGERKSAPVPVEKSISCPFDAGHHQKSAYGKTTFVFHSITNE